MKKATRQHTKAHNSQLVLKLIYDSGKISRADIARQTQLTRTTVSQVVSELIAQGLVEEVGFGESAGGKSPILLSVISNSYHIIGVDLASNEFRGAVVNLRGEIVHSVSLPVSSRSGDEALALVYQLLDTLVASTDRPLVGIGIGTPGLVDTNQGLVRRAVNLDWHDLPLGELLKVRYNVPVYLANDSQATALAEYNSGGWQADQSLVVVRVGQGIGAGIVLEGRLFQGDGSSAGEIGHLVVAESGDLCRCGNRGCLETVASEHALLQRAAALARTAPQSALSQLAPEALTLAALQQALEQGDTVAQQVAAEAGHYLGLAVACLVSTLNVRNILLTGNVTRLGAPLLDVIQKEMSRHALSSLAQDTRVAFGRFGTDVVIWGASALLLTRELKLSFTRPGDPVPADY
jgi:N-acetylglucosamine repressor